MNEHIQQMIDWFERNLKKGFSLDELSRYMGYSPYYCSFKFHQVTVSVLDAIFFLEGYTYL